MKKVILARLSNSILKYSVRTCPVCSPNVYNFVKILKILTKALVWKYVATHGSFALCQIHIKQYFSKVYAWLNKMGAESYQNMGF